MSHTIYHPSRRADRHGLVSGMLVCAMVVILAMVGLAWNVALVTYAHDEFRETCEAAALAAAAELMDEGVLTGVPNQLDDVAHARFAAIHLAQENRNGPYYVDLDFNGANRTDGDIVLGWVNDPTTIGQPLFVAGPDDPVNSVRVSAVRSRRRGNPISLWLSNWLSNSAVDAKASARASLDPRVYGFRPTGDSATPVGSLAADANAWLNQATAPAQPGVNDRFAVNLRSGAVLFEPDGIPEIELHAPLAASDGNAAGNMVAILVDPIVADSATLQRQLLTGLTARDLTLLGGEFSIANGALFLPAQVTFDPSWVDVFEAGQARPRVWPLGIVTDVSGASGLFEATSFGAATTIVAWIDDGAETPQLVVLIQPCMLPTSSALANPAAAPNPWIAKLMLTQ